MDIEFSKGNSTNVAGNHFKQPVIKVVGIGGGGGNVIQRMRSNCRADVEYIALNTDAAVIESSKADKKSSSEPRLPRDKAREWFPR